MVVLRRIPRLIRCPLPLGLGGLPWHAAAPIPKVGKGSGGTRFPRFLACYRIPASISGMSAPMVSGVTTPAPVLMVRPAKP